MTQPNKKTLSIVIGLERIHSNVNHTIATTIDEIELVRRAQSGDRGAYCDLVRQHRPGVINVVYRLCGDSQLAEDAAQESFIRAWQNLEKYTHRSAFRNWIYRIATNAALDVLRKDRDELDIDDVAIASKRAGPENSLEAAQRAELVQQAVLAMPAASRVVLVLREYEGLSYREISETLKIPIGTVMSRLNYGRKLLREQLAPLMEEI